MSNKLNIIGRIEPFLFQLIDEERERERNNLDKNFRTENDWTGRKKLLERSPDYVRFFYDRQRNHANDITRESIPRYSCDTVLRSMCAVTCVIQRGILWSHLHTEFVPKVRRLQASSRVYFPPSNRARCLSFLLRVQYRFLSFRAITANLSRSRPLSYFSSPREINRNYTDLNCYSQISK